MSLEYLLTWMMVLLRTLGIILQLPVVAGRPLPVTVQIALCACIATLLAGIVPLATIPPTLWDLLLAVGGEVLLGLALGFVGRMAFAAVEMAGRIMTTEIGLSANPGLGVPEPANEPLAALVSTFAIVLFFVFGGHLMMLSALARTFTLAPTGHPGLSPAAGDMLVREVSHMLELGVRIAAPFIAMNFLVTLAFSALGRVVPKMSVFIISFSVRVIAGFTLLGTAGALLARYLYMEFGDTPTRMLQIVAGH
jgi:flagellar biosynthetic protein FliR